MSFKLNIMKTLCVLNGFLFFSTVSVAQYRPELFGTLDSNNKKEAFTFDSEISLELQQDQLRPENNPNKTNIRNLSLGLNYKKHTNTLRFEILGEQNPLSNDINVAVGEFYVTGQIQDLQLPTQFIVGAMKIDYGILNDLDGVLSFLPSYYSILYDLPRGIDSGAGMNTAFLNESLSLSGFVYLGRNLRQVDAQNQRLDVVPHHLKLSWNHEDFKLSLNYFSRKYEAQSLIQGVGLEFVGFERSFFKSWVKFNLNSEVFALETSLNGTQNRGLAGLIQPEFEIQSVLLRTIVAMEQWTQNQKSSRELYSTLGLGYKLNENIKFYVEQSQIQNLTNQLTKEESFQFRIVSNWTF